MIPLLGYSSSRLNRNLQMQHKKLPQQITFSNISVMSWQLVVSVEETGVPGENHRSVASQ